MNNSLIDSNSFYNTRVLLGLVNFTNVSNNFFNNSRLVTGSSGLESFYLNIYNNNILNYGGNALKIDYTQNSMIWNNTGFNNNYCITFDNSSSSELWNSSCVATSNLIMSHGILINDDSFNITVHDCYVENASFGYLFEWGTHNSTIYNSQQIGGSIFYSLHDTHDNVAYNNYIEGDIVFLDNVTRECFYNNTVTGDLSFKWDLDLGSEGTGAFNNTVKDTHFVKDLFVQDNSTGNILINVTWGRSEIVDSINISSYVRKWYLDSSSNVDGTNITLSNSTTVLYSALSPNFETQTVLAYINEGGTVTNETYTITAVKDGYVSQSETFNLTGNKDKIFTLVADDSFSSSSSGSSGTPTYYPTETNLKEGYTRSLGNGWNFRFSFKNESHKFNVDNINGDVVTITVSSDPITFDLEVNDSKKIDLDSDGYYDFLISLNEIAGSSSYARAEVYVLAIDEKVVEDKNGSKEDNEGEGLIDGINEEVEENSWFVYFVLVLIIVVGIISFLKSRKRK